jgi:hypothetical protein
MMTQSPVMTSLRNQTAEILVDLHVKCRYCWPMCVRTEVAPQYQILQKSACPLSGTYMRTEGRTDGRTVNAILKAAA